MTERTTSLFSVHYCMQWLWDEPFVLLLILLVAKISRTRLKISCNSLLPQTVAACRCRLHHLLLHYNSIASSVSSQNVSSWALLAALTRSTPTHRDPEALWCDHSIVEHNTKLNSLVLTLMRSDQCDCVAHQIETAHWSRATQEKCWLLKVVGSIWCNQLGCISRRDILCKQPVTQSAPHPAAFILSNCIALYYFAVELSLSSPTAVHWVVQPVLLCSCNFYIKPQFKELAPKALAERGACISIIGLL